MSDVTNPLTVEQCDRLRELLDRATPGPWYTLDPPWLANDCETSILAGSPDPHVARFICDFDLWAIDDEDDRKSVNPDADATLIVEAVNALPALLDAAQSTASMRAEIAAKDVRIAELEQDVIAFCGPWAGQYAEQSGLPTGHLHPTHYDILERAGARMDEFTRATLAGEPRGG